MIKNIWFDQDLWLSPDIKPSKKKANTTTAYHKNNRHKVQVAVSGEGTDSWRHPKISAFIVHDIQLVRLVLATRGLSLRRNSRPRCNRPSSRESTRVFQGALIVKLQRSAFSASDFLLRLCADRNALLLIWLMTKSFSIYSMCISLGRIEVCVLTRKIVMYSTVVQYSFYM